jgi:hypothetical protein
MGKRIIYLVVILLNMAIYSGFTYKTCIFSMAMLVYQKVFHGNSGCTILRQTHFRTMSLRTCCVAH